MPLFIDVHTIDAEGSAAEAAEAHARDLETQGAQDSDLVPFWIGQKAGKVFWLVEAPSAEAAQAAHHKTHGPMASEIYEVQAGSAWFSRRREGGGT
jgi:hypothetical protein